jgi:hypothetical protein
MASIFDPLINDPEDKAQNEALVRALRNQTGLGIVGQGMGLQATSQIGQGLQKGAQQSFGEAMQARERAKQIKMQQAQLQAEAQHRQQAQNNWQRSFDAQRGEFATEQERLRNKAETPDPMKVYRGEDQMRSQFDRQMGDIGTTLDATGKVKQLLPGALGRKPNAVEQQSIVVLLNKFLDPTSVVREAEFDRVVQAQGLVNRADNYINRIAAGEPLAEDMVRDIGVMAALYEKAATLRGQQIAKGYRDTAGRRGYDVNSIIMDPRFGGGQSGPPPGSVVEIP